MTFKKTEKEILKAMVKYGSKDCSIANVLNKSRLLEDRGIVMAFENNRNYVFLDKQKYDYEDVNAVGYITELISLIKYLIENRLITILPINTRETLVVGRRNSRYAKPGYIVVDDAFLEVESNMGDWIDRATRQQTYWPNSYSEREFPLSKYLECSFSVSQELRDLVKHDFKTEKERRFRTQVRLTWISITVSIIIGLCSLIIGVFGILTR